MQERLLTTRWCCCPAMWRWSDYILQYHCSTTWWHTAHVQDPFILLMREFFSLNDSTQIHTQFSWLRHLDQWFYMMNDVGIYDNISHRGHFTVPAHNDLYLYLSGILYIVPVLLLKWSIRKVLSPLLRCLKKWANEPLMELKTLYRFNLWPEPMSRNTFNGCKNCVTL